jgi:hypothetical protein
MTSLDSETEDERNADDERQDDNPYSSPDTNCEPVRVTTRSYSRLIFGACIAFSLPAILLLLLAWPCSDYGYTTQHRGRVLFFMYGGHAICIAATWGIAIALTRTRSRDSVVPATCVGLGLAAIYLPTTALCWLMVAFGVISWT